MLEVTPVEIIDILNQEKAEINIPTVICIQCGKAFSKKHGRKYCSRKCSRKRNIADSVAHNRNSACRWCGRFSDKGYACSEYCTEMIAKNGVYVPPKEARSKHNPHNRK